jgi:hypothetical protein
VRPSKLACDNPPETVRPVRCCHQHVAPSDPHIIVRQAAYDQAPDTGGWSVIRCDRLSNLQLVVFHLIVLKP